MKYNDEIIRAFLNFESQKILFEDFKLPKSFIEECGIHDYSVGAYLMANEPYEYYEYRFVFDFVNLEYEIQAKIIDAFEDSIYKRFNSVNHDLYIEEYGIHDYSVGAFLMLDEPHEYYEYRFVFDFVNLEYEIQAKIIDAFEDSIYKRFNSVNHDLYIEKRGFPDSKYRELFPNINPDEIMRIVFSINFKKYL